jgi:hypothetical protein
MLQDGGGRFVLSTFVDYDVTTEIVIAHRQKTNGSSIESTDRRGGGGSSDGEGETAEDGRHHDLHREEDDDTKGEGGLLFCLSPPQTSTHRFVRSGVGCSIVEIPLATRGSRVVIKARQKRFDGEWDGEWSRGTIAL